MSETIYVDPKCYICTRMWTVQDVYPAGLCFDHIQTKCKKCGDLYDNTWKLDSETCNSCVKKGKCRFCGTPWASDWKLASFCSSKCLKDKIGPMNEKTMDKIRDFQDHLEKNIKFT